GDDIHTRAELLQAEAIRLLRGGELDEAESTLEQAQAIVDAAGLQQEYVAPVPAWLATVRRRQLEAADAYHISNNKKSLVDALGTAKAAVRLAQKYPNNLPHALRERGLLY